ncbi:hypothetical protein FQN50_008798 [Emmonsiellopsis sp. PD_5]|nr:hypothetical protein FQN50_008798 [Emmonsiellopsis sp. PD_5]
MACVGTRCLGLQGDNLLKLLEHFQPEMPDHLLCYQCCSFHHKWKVMTGQHNECYFTNGRVSVGLRMLTFVDVQHAMNAHLYGQRHQIPFIRFTYHGKEEAAHHRTYQDAELRLSGNDILLVQRLRPLLDVRYYSKRMVPIPRARFEDPFTLCPHLHYTALLTQIPAMLANAFLKCPVCATEIEARLASRFQTHTTICVNITAVRLLGPCRTPNERQWRLHIEGMHNRFEKPLVNDEAQRVLWPRYQESTPLPRSPWFRRWFARRPTSPHPPADPPDSDIV